MAKARYLYSELASAIGARKRCLAAGDNMEWADKWGDYIEKLISLLPSGSGVDNGTKLDFDASHEEKLVLLTAFHHMDEQGGYNGWTHHVITVTPSFRGFNMRISGRNQNDIKEYLSDIYSADLDQEVSSEYLNGAL